MLELSLKKGLSLKNICNKKAENVGEASLHCFFCIQTFKQGKERQLDMDCYLGGA